MSSLCGKKAAILASKKRKGASSSSGPTAEVRHPFLRLPTLEQVQLADDVRALLTSDPWDLFFAIIEPTYLELTLELCSTFHVQYVMTNFDDPGIVQFRLGEEFMDENNLSTLRRHIHYSLLKCWYALIPGSATYDPSRSKTSGLSPSLRYLHAILAHTLIGRRERTGVVNTHDAYFLWSMANGHVLDLAYFIALTIRHQMERYRRGVISIGPYVTRLARHFGLLNTVAQSSSLTLIGQMSPQGISSMLSMRMIAKRRGSQPLQYRLAQSTEDKAPEDITDDFPSQPEDPPSQPPPPSRPVHAAASYTDISEHLTRFEQ
ncbi:hypothetical protein GOBAR_AA32109 [Gossypium barbadense]|uniref:Arabidopsis retrotransposon Orf1 C-terminal domain-containing protein n=1 Tax=Gossypium barbadense TaxID=3634 RepID=A0A2P5WBY5_GOSBA|nr:hypothetical protein GOBAR_AA32109 [Gossypium barbadense]